VGHANASRIFDSYIVTVGRGATLNMNIPPERTGQMNASVFQVPWPPAATFCFFFFFRS
jgi:hypothetical protein